MSITGLSVKKSTTVIVMSVFFFVAGTVSYMSLPREAAPDVKIPYMIISTVYAGVSPEDIENLITRKIENELKSLEDVKEITSSSSESFSQIGIEFDPKVDLDTALQKVKDRVDVAKSELPEEVEDPVVTEINFENMPIVNIILTADYDITELKNVADDLSDRFEAIPGVLSADVTGALEREIKIKVDPARLQGYNLSMNDVSGAIQAEDITIPGGTMDIGDFSYTVRVPGEIKDPEQFKNLVITGSGQGPVYLRDVAAVEYGFKDATTISRLNGKPAITIGVTKRTGENIIRISDQIKQILDSRESSFPSGTHVILQGDMSKFIRVMLGELDNNIWNGFFLVILCIFMFLGITNSVFIATAIPLSIFITFIVLALMGVTLNFIVLFSLILALGMLVDNAIVIVENIYRHRNMGKDPIRAAVDGTDEVAGAVTSSTLTTVAAFSPILFWPGIMGDFMKYLPITVIVALLASLFVGLVINPVLCARYMKVKKEDMDRFTGGSGFFYGKIMTHYEKVLRLSTSKPKTTLAIAFGTLVLSIFLYGIFGKGVEFFPETDPDAMWIEIKGPVGQRLEATDKVTRQLEATSKTFPDIETMVTNVGISASSSGLVSGGNPTNEARIYMDLVDFEKRSQPSLKTFQESVEKINYLPGTEVKLAKDEGGPPVGEPVEIQIAGDDFMTLGDIARKIRTKIRNTPGLVDLKDDFESSKPEIRITVDREKAGLLGLRTQDIAFAVRTAINGFDAGDFRVEEDEYDITVRFAQEYRRALSDLNRVFIFKDGRQIPLSSVADFTVAAGFGTIRRADLKRVVTITGTNHGRLANDVLNDVKRELRGYPLPEGYILSYRGEDEEQQDAAIFLGKALMVALFLIAMIIVSQFDSLIITLIIMSSVILSTIGALWGLMIQRMPFGIIMTGVGIISLAGVVVNNAIVLLDYTEKLRMWGRTKYEAVIEAGKTRFRPVILTAIVTVVGVIPLATGWSLDVHTLKFVAGGSSTQWWAPMAIVIIYGLSFATVLTLIVVPSMYMIIGTSDEKFHRHK